MSTRRVIGVGEMRTLHMLHALEVAVGDDGSTVRLGFKWADLKRGETIWLCVCTRHPHENDEGVVDETHEVQGKGQVEKLWFGYFKDIPAKAISVEHELRSREYWGLYDSMRYAYGDAFGEWSPVTVIQYVRRA